jgi:hypothetical protein
MGKGETLMKNPIMLCFSILFLFVGSISCSVADLTQTIPSSKLVEVGLLGSMTPYKSQFPLLQLENEYPNIDAISFEPSFHTFNPSPYCFQYYEEVRKYMQLDRGYPQTICHRTKYFLGVPKNETGYDWSKWIPIVYEKIKDSSASTDIVLVQPHVECTEDSYTATAQLKWEKPFPIEDFKNLRYSIFLKADRIYYFDYLDPHYSVENLAYDMIPLSGDVKEEYSGCGFPLFSSADEYPTEQNPNFSLTTEPFTIPFIDGFPKNQQPKWSLHLLINDGTDMGKNLYSWSFPIEIEEE